MFTLDFLNQVVNGLEKDSMWVILLILYCFLSVILTLVFLVSLFSISFHHILFILLLSSSHFFATPPLSLFTHSHFLSRPISCSFHTILPFSVFESVYIHTISPYITLYLTLLSINKGFVYIYCSSFPLSHS